MNEFKREEKEEIEREKKREIDTHTHTRTRTHNRIKRQIAVIEREGDRERDRERERDRQTDRDRQTERDRQRDRERVRQRFYMHRRRFYDQWEDKRFPKHCKIAMRLRKTFRFFWQNRTPLPAPKKIDRASIASARRFASASFFYLQVNFQLLITKQIIAILIFFYSPQVASQ